jgi:3-demethylubiquinone-9 3-methyltransferase
VDHFWNTLIADGGEESKCGWLKGKFGVSWQVVPTALGRYLSDPDRKKGRSRHAGHVEDEKDRHRRSRQGICRLIPEKSSRGMRTGVSTKPGIPPKNL